MLRSIIICPDQEMAQRLEAVLGTTGDVLVSRIVSRYPVLVDLVRTLRAHAPGIVFLSFEVVEKAQEVVKSLESEAPGTQIIAIQRNCDAALLRETMRVGVREFVAYPFERQAVVDSLVQVAQLLQKSPPVHDSTNQIFAFLPSKAGVGTSTLALNVSAALSRRKDTRVLLSDFDLNSGMMRFMLKLQNEYSVIDAVEHCLHIDEHLWPQLVTTLGTLDVLHAGRINPNIRVETTHVRNLIDFARRNYQALCFDLSGNLERYSIEIMQEAKRVLMVCTPEIASLHQAREKLHFLKTFELESRISVVLNRCQKRAMFTTKQVEEILGAPVLKMFPNDYHGVNRALTAGACIDPKSDLGKAMAEFADELMERRAPVPQGEQRKFIEFFAVPSTRYVSGEK